MRRIMLALALAGALVVSALTVGTTLAGASSPASTSTVSTSVDPTRALSDSVVGILEALLKLDAGTGLLTPELKNELLMALADANVSRIKAEVRIRAEEEEEEEEDENRVKIRIRVELRELERGMANALANVNNAAERRTEFRLRARVADVTDEHLKVLEDLIPQVPESVRPDLQRALSILRQVRAGAAADDLRVRIRIEQRIRDDMRERVEIRIEDEDEDEEDEDEVRIERRIEIDEDADEDEDDDHGGHGGPGRH